jgi:hypothetical protein
MSNHKSTRRHAGKLTPSTEGVTYKSPAEQLTMNKYHVFWIIEQLLKEPKGIKWQDVLIPLALFVGLLLAYLPTNFKDCLGIKSAVWEAIVLILLGCSAIATFILFIMWCVHKAKNPHKTTDQIYDEITARMAKDENQVKDRKDWED